MRPRASVHAPIIANEVHIYSSPCSLEITFSRIKTSSISTVRPVLAQKLKSIHFAEKARARSAELGLFLYLFLRLRMKLETREASGASCSG